jgi:hypothetical protein
VPEHEPQPFEACDVCGRTILRGERIAEYVTPDGESRGVCTLCRLAAEDAGWVRADSASAHTPTPPRRRRGLRGLRLRERAGQLAARARPPAPEPPEPAPEPEPKEESPPPPPPPPATPERRMRQGIERFNASDTTRVVAGLTRSLGRPQAAVRELSGPARIQVTVAWDLSWYRWEVGLNGEEGPQQVAKGAEVEELAGDGIVWNATVDESGRVRWREGS